MMSIRVIGKESTMGSIDLDYHDGEGEHHDGLRGRGGHAGERELEGGGEILAPLKAWNWNLSRIGWNVWGMSIYIGNNDQCGAKLTLMLLETGK
jgi:hypothetical protein